MRAIHFLELRARIDALRRKAGLAVYVWTDPALIAGATPVKVVHLTELRTALDEAYVAAARPAPVYDDAAVAGGTGIRAAHLMELREAVAALETWHHGDGTPASRATSAVRRAGWSKDAACRVTALGPAGHRRTRARIPNRAYAA